MHNFPLSKSLTAVALAIASIAANAQGAGQSAANAVGRFGAAGEQHFASVIPVGGGTRHGGSVLVLRAAPSVTSAGRGDGQAGMNWPLRATPMVQNLLMVREH